MREKIEKALLWVSALLGLLIIGACTVAGAGERGGIGLAFAGCFGGAILAMILLGWVYAYFVLRRDLKAIHAEISKLRSGTPHENP